MTQEGRYVHGEFCWADLTSRDPAAAKRFYTALFGWSYVDEPVPGGGGGTYTLCCLDGANVAGLYATCPEQPQPAWSAYAAVNDCAASVAAAGRLGGTVLAPLVDIEGVGRMAVIADPEGAALSLWQADSPHPGFARLGPRPGTVVWNELAARVPAAAKTFYQNLFGWGVKETAMPDHPYVEWLVGDRPAGGMLPLAAIGADVPPHWLVYFACADCDATAAQAVAAGGMVLRAPFDVPDVGRLAVLADGDGAAFAVIRLTMAAA